MDAMEVAGDGRPPGVVSQTWELAHFTRLYAWTVSPLVERELRRWQRRAEAIPDPTLRQRALGKLDDAGAHVWLNTTAATRAPAAPRREVVEAITAYEALYDYLDARTERSASFEEARRLFDAFVLPFEEDLCTLPDDDGYLRDLALAARASFRALPSHRVVAPVAAVVAARAADAQSHFHASDTSDFERWTRAQGIPDGLAWWEAAAGRCAEVITLHALIALAARTGATSAEATHLVARYQCLCALATLLDHAMDEAEDRRTGAPNFMSCYRSTAEAEAGIANVARLALAATAAMPRPAQHALTVTGIVGYYLSAPERARARVRGEPTLRALRPMSTLLLLVFRLLRRARRKRFPPIRMGRPRRRAAQRQPA